MDSDLCALTKHNVWLMEFLASLAAVSADLAARRARSA